MPLIYMVIYISICGWPWETIVKQTEDHVMTSILLFKNTTIEKRLLSGGKGDVPDFIDGTKVCNCCLG